MIPARNEEKYIFSTIGSLCEQDYPSDKFEIIVVDGMSDDNTLSEVQRAIDKHKKHSIKYFKNEDMLSSFARNIAVENANGEFVLLLDAHVYLPSKLLLSDSIQLAKDNQAMVLARSQPLDPPEISDFQILIALARDSKIAHSGESYIYSDYEGWVSPISAAVMYHRDIFKKIGMFDTNFDAAEDYEFNYRIERAGINCFISPKLKVRYYPRDSLKMLFKQMGRYGYGRALFVQKYPERFTIETIIPASFVIFMALGPIVLISNNLLALAWGFIFFLYGVILLLASIRIPKKRKIIDTSSLMAIFFTVHLGMGTGFLKGIFSGFKKRWLHGRQKH